MLAQLLHWGIATLIVLQLALGVYAANLPVSLARLQWLSWHKSLGLTLLLLIALRALWRSWDAPPALPAAVSAWERRAAHLMHIALYLVPVLAALTGWLYASAAGLSVNWFGLWLVPDLMSKNVALAALFKGLHQGLVGALVLLLLGHVGAALRHAWRGDGLFQRMWSWRTGGRP